GRARVRRGDWQLAVEPLERAAAVWRGTAPSPDGAAVALALVQAYVQAGRLADAMPVAFEAMRQVRAGMPLPDWAQGSSALIDASRCLPAAVAPMALSGADAANAAMALRAFDAQGDAALAHAAEKLAALLERTDEGASDRASDREPAVPTSPAPRATESDRQGFALLDGLRDAMSDDAATRAKARRSLATLKRSLPPWSDAWIRYATGDSLTREPETQAKERGVVLLLSVDVSDRLAQPMLAAAARARAAAALASLGNASGAERIRNSGPSSPIHSPETTRP
ncbi:MAG: hypothetical protein JNK53_08470, partial [Phycisphaerae bacterium]|nr:hypothetical protein [Phycisphaerae bacterium]